MKNSKKIIKYVLFLFLFANLSFAEQHLRIGNIGFGGSLNENLHLIISGLVKLFIPLLVLALVYIGFRFIQAQGDPEELKKVKNYFLWALLGIAIILGANLILTSIEDTVENSGLLDIHTQI
jgi:hypothetical protein